MHKLDRYKRQLSSEELLNLSPEELCKDRLSEEYFRLTTEGDCRDVVRFVFYQKKKRLSVLEMQFHFSIFRCDRAGLAGTIRLAAVRCPAGLAFDINRQTCDWKAKVDNCDRLSSMNNFYFFKSQKNIYKFLNFFIFFFVIYFRR